MSLAGSADRTLSTRRLIEAVQERFGHLLHELAKFGVVGAVAYLVDIVTFNILRSGPMDDRPLTAKIVSTVAATTVAYLGNRAWTFRHRGGRGMRREYLLFFGLNAFGLAIALGSLGVSHYLLGFTSPLADNISANVLGMAMGTVFRFWAYRRFVFLAPADPVLDRPEDPRAEPVPA